MQHKEFKYLAISKLSKCVNYDTKNNVESNCGKEDEEA